MRPVPHILLASQSPRRSQLLREAGFNYTLVSVNVEEKFSPTLKKAEVAEYLSELKSFAYGPITGNDVLMTADTIVCLGNKVIGKPESRAHAIEMLGELSGKMHEVYTAVTLRNSSHQKTFSERTEVYFATLTPSEIEWYVDKYNPMDKAGAYGIQEWIGYIAIKKVVGCFYNVMGLPVSRLYEEIRNF